MSTRPAKQKPDALLVRVLARLGTADIREGFIAGQPNEIIHGLWEQKGQRATITVNPMHHVVDTVIHELLHDLFPAWSENYVRNRTSFIKNRLSDAQIEAIYEEYKTKVKNV